MAFINISVGKLLLKYVVTSWRWRIDAEWFICCCC